MSVWRVIGGFDRTRNSRHMPSIIPAMRHATDALRGACWDSPDCKGLKTRLVTCQQALAENANDPRVKMALSRALSVARRRDEAVALMRSAAEPDDPAALFAPLATALYRGGAGLKRDPTSARVWGERALRNSPPGMRTGDIQPVVGEWLSQSDDPEARTRGIALLESLPGRGDAQSYLAQAVRASDPVRARKLLGSAAHTYPGHALAPPAEMLIAGEGGPKDERRALALLEREALFQAQGSA
jgi:TPR repeat protein